MVSSLLDTLDTMEVTLVTEPNPLGAEEPPHKASRTRQPMKPLSHQDEWCPWGSKEHFARHSGKNPPASAGGARDT